MGFHPKNDLHKCKMLGYGQNIQSDWTINASEIKIFYPLTHQGSHAFHKNRRKGKQNLPLVDLNSNPYLIRKLIYIIIYLTITVTITVM